MFFKVSEDLSVDVADIAAIERIGHIIEITLKPGNVLTAKFTTYDGELEGRITSPAAAQLQFDALQLAIAFASR